MTKRIVGDVFIIAAWAAFVGSFLLWVAPGWPLWASALVVLVSIPAGCAIGGSWARRAMLGPTVRLA